MRIFKFMKETEYEKLRLDILKKLIEARNIPCKQTKEDIIKHLIMDDKGEYVYATTVEKQPKGKFMVGVCVRNRTLSIQLNRLVDKGDAVRLKMYANNRVYFITKYDPTDN
jgi:hypothetical protein